jgi:hypothetical protein
VQEVAAGLWHWQAPHPEWDDSVWPQVVSSYAIDDGERLLLFDPIAPPDEIVTRADGRELVVVLTSPWHERDTRALVEKHNPPVFVTQPEPDSPDVVDQLLPLLDFPVEHVLATHGGPHDRAALQNALA